MNRIFLEAEWRKLAMANYSVPPSLLQKYLPYKTELDLWNDTCYVSLVGFLFDNTRLKGFRIPFHTRFEEVNLRFYVRYKEGDTWKRGVVFLSEIVPKPALAFVANTIYNERYTTCYMQHSWLADETSLTAEYKWKKSNWNSFKITAGNTAFPLEEGSETAFITEHYWGYTKRGINKSSEYGVEHPKWGIYKTMNHSIDVNFSDVYGPQFGFLSDETPKSVFLAEGSEVIIREGTLIR
ncbi:MAG: DUF2071 domain-containing protein [Chitinophagaceae bacterium]|nr:DUF2071 domain-containing protein [Chitinophagaceae bacterium]